MDEKKTSDSSLPAKPIADETEPAAPSKTALAEDDAEDIVELLEGVPIERQHAIMRVLSTSMSHSGWLPTPRDLAKYEEILPGLAERIASMPEREQAHRHLVVETMTKRDFALKGRGQIFALLSLMLLLGFAMFLALQGQYAWASRVAIFAIVGVVGIFVTGKWADVKAAKAADEEDEDE